MNRGPSKATDGFASLQGGMNGGVLNTAIPFNQYAKGINVTCRNGVLGTRPRVVEVDVVPDGSAAECIAHGKFQGSYTYQYQDTTFIAFGMNGRIFLIDPVAEVIYDMTSVIGAMSSTVDRLHFCQAHTYLVVQDGTNLATIIESTAARKAVAADDEVPIGTIMAYVHGRLFIKTGDRQFVAGNILLPNDPGSVLVFTETEYLAGGTALFIPVDLGNITGMTWAQNYGEATGDGPLIVMCDRGMVSYRVSVPRMQWQDMPIMKIEPGGNGNASEYGVVRFNEDLLFMSWNGLQDFALLSTENATKHRLTNLDSEIAPLLALEDPKTRRLVSACKFDDRLLYTALCEPTTAAGERGETLEDFRFTGLISLDYAPSNGIASMGQISKPAYDGIWTGFHPMGLSSGIFDYEEMCFVFGKDDEGVNHLYRLMKEQGPDVSLAKGAIPVQSRVYTRGMPFVVFDNGNSISMQAYEKQLRSAYLNIVSFFGSLDIGLYSCPDFSVRFNEISRIRVTAPEAESGYPFAVGRMQCRPKEKFPAFNQHVCQPVSGKLAVRGFEFQFLLTWSGVLNVSRFAIEAEARMEISSLECGTNTQVLLDTDPEDLSYDIEA